MFEEVAKYAFFGGLAWGGVALLGHIFYWIQVRIKTRRGVIDRVEKLHEVLEEGFKELEKAKRLYESLIADIEDSEDAGSAVGKKLH